MAALPSSFNKYQEAIGAKPLATAYTFTEIESNKPISKKIWLSPTGKIKKHSSANVAGCTTQHVQIGTISQFATYLDALSPNKAMCSSVTTETPATFCLSYEHKKNPQQGVIPRSKEFFEFLPAPGFLGIDYDSRGTVLTPDELRQAFYNVWPAMAKAPHVSRPSTSSCIYNGEVEVYGLRGQRMYVGVVDASDIPRCIDVLGKRLWLSGYGGYWITEGGQMRNYTLLDEALGQLARLDFCGGAVCTPPLVQRMPASLVYNQDAPPVDTRTTLLDLTPAEVAQLETMQRDAREVLKPELMEKRLAVADKKANEQGKNATQTKALKAKYFSAMEDCILFDDMQLYTSSHGVITVRDLLDNKEKYDGISMCDPLEPTYNNSNNTVAQAQLLTSKQGPAIYSHAHGGCHYILQRKEEVAEVMEKCPLATVLQDSPPLDSTLFPQHLINAATEVSDWTATDNLNPPVMAGVQTVSVMLGKKVRIHEIKDDLVHPCSMGTVVAAPSGYRKTEIYKKMGAPLFEFEEKIQMKWEEDKASNKVVVAALEAEIKKRKTKAAQGDRTVTDIERDTLESITLQLRIDELSKARPTLLIEDSTEEKLVRVLDAQDCTIGIFSDDGRNTIRNIAGLRRQDGSGENLYLKGFTNGDYTYNRVGVDDKFPDIVLRRICMNAFIFIQPDMMVDLINSEGFAESGLGARFFLQMATVDPVKLMKNSTRRQLDQTKLTPYYNVLRKLTVEVPKPVDVYLSDEAGDYWDLFKNHLADNLNTAFQGRYDLINKAMTLTTKMATVFLALEDGELLTKTSAIIPLDLYVKACKFVQHLMLENLKMGEFIHEERLLKLAGNLMLWLEKNNMTLFQVDGSFKRKQSAERKKVLPELLDILQEYGHLHYDPKDHWYAVL